jgi:hypothetical protein
MDWVYHHLNPEQNQSSNRPEEIIASGYAWCAGYTRVFQYLLERENFRTRRATFYMKPHPRGRGPQAGRYALDDRGRNRRALAPGRPDLQRLLQRTCFCRIGRGPGIGRPCTRAARTGTRGSGSVAMSCTARSGLLRDASSLTMRTGRSQDGPVKLFRISKAGYENHSASAQRSSTGCT